MIRCGGAAIGGPRIGSLAARSQRLIVALCSSLHSDMDKSQFDLPFFEDRA